MSPTQSSSRIPSTTNVGFCFGVAMVAASLANVLVESASNRGWFGPGVFTDHSYWDIPPVLLTAIVLLAGYAWLRIRAAFGCGGNVTERTLESLRSLLGSDPLRIAPTVFAAQLAILYAMETAEQVLVYGHALGGNLWLGGPPALALMAHGLVSIAILLLIAFALRVLGEASALVIQWLRIFMLLRVRDAQPPFLEGFQDPTGRRSARIVCNVGERAPPLLTV